MKTTTLFSRLTVLGLFFMLFSPRVLYAIPRDGMGIEGSPGARRAMMSTDRLRIEGELTCVSSENETCTLNIKDNRTGRTYRLTGADNSARQIFESGNRKAIVEGILANDSTLNVQTTEAF